MAFVFEKVPQEEWDFVRKYAPNKELSKYTLWKVDREREIYFFDIGGESREQETYYMLIWKGKKVFIDTWSGARSIDDKAYNAQMTYRIWGFQADKALESYREELIEIVKEVLQAGKKIPIVIEKMAEPKFVEVKYN